MILSKPISRASFLLGKYFGQVTVQALVTFAMALLTMAICSRFDAPVSYLAIAQTSLLIVFEAACLTAITFFFAVNAGAITAAIAALSLLALGHLRETAAKAAGDTLEKLGWQLVKGLVPNLEVFNMKALASYGFAI